MPRAIRPIGYFAASELADGMDAALGRGPMAWIASVTIGVAGIALVRDSRGDSRKCA